MRDKKNDLVNIITGEYGFEIRDIQSLDDKEIPRAFKIITSNEIFVLRLFDSRTRDKLESDITVLKFLEEKEFPAPKVIQSLKSQNIFTYGIQTGFVTSFIEGKHPILNNQTIEKTAILIAKLHSLKISPNIPISTWNISEGNKLVAQNIQQLSSQKIEHWDEIIPQLTEAFKQLPDLTNLPPVLIHTDIGINNTIESSNGTLTFIDWDDAGVGQSVIDIGNVLSQVLISFKDNESLDPIFDEELAKVFLDAYQVIRPLSHGEKKQIVTGMQFCALSYVLLEWIPKIALQNWKRYAFIKENSDLIISLMN